MDNELEHWMNVWADAQKSDLFKGAEKPKAKQPHGSTGFFGNYSGDDNSVGDIDSLFWENMVSLARGGHLREDLVPVTKPDKDSVAQVVDAISKTVNSTSAANRGPDASNHITPNWAGGEQLAELADMKIKLEKLESAFNAAEGTEQTDKAKKIQAQIKQIHAKISDLSNQIQPEFRTEYLS